MIKFGFWDQNHGFEEIAEAILTFYKSSLKQFNFNISCFDSILRLVEHFFWYITTHNVIQIFFQSFVVLSKAQNLLLALL